MESKITVIINTYNEEKNIADAIKSALQLTPNIFVVDLQSQDQTVTIAKKYPVQLVSFPYSSYVEHARSFSIEKAQSEWIFVLDADERITPELVNEIKLIVYQGDPSTSLRMTGQASHFKVPRKEIFGKKFPLNHGGWWPNYQYRLFRKDSFIDWPKDIHSTPSFKGDLGYLKNYLLHFSQNDFHKIVEKTIIFETAESDLLYKANKPVTTLTFFRKFFGELFRRLIKKRGFLDGRIGIIESLYQAFSKTITYIYLYEKKKSSSL